MRLILNLAFALALVSGTTMLTGCDKKAGTETKQTTKTTTPSGATEKTEKTDKTETTAPKDNK